ncbi:MAG: DUF934 domain-containing protein [Pseudomonadota bacterium]
MPLIKDGAEIEDEWVFVEAEDELPATGQIVVRLAQFLENADTLLSRNVPVGVHLSPDSDPHELAPYLDRLGLIEVDFPKYVDGRGYSQAQLLRRRLDYKGELRAVGNVLLDQIFYMNRSGFDAYSTTRADLPKVLRALEEFSEVYQPGATGRTSVFHKRHMVRE